MAEDSPCGGREPGPGELYKGEGEEGRAAGATRMEGQEGRPRRGRKLGSLSAKQEERGEQERGERERRSRQEGLHPLLAGVMGPPCSEQREVTPGGLRTAALARVPGMHAQMDRSGQVGARHDFLAREWRDFSTSEGSGLCGQDRVGGQAG